MAAPVLIFDSGVGGLSVARALRDRLPGAPLAYVCDNAAMPYGTKPDGWLVRRIVAVCQAALAASAAQALVVACNTASTLALEALRAQLTVPVIGTVPAIKPAAHLTRSGVIGLLATTATVGRPYTDRLIADFACQCRVVRVAADALVMQAERQVAGAGVETAVVEDCLAPLWREPELDTVVLGCTHFPLLNETLAACAPRPLQWIDSGSAIARRVVQVLGERITADTGVACSWSTAPASAGLVAGLAGFGFAAPHLLAVSERVTVGVAGQP